MTSISSPATLLSQMLGEISVERFLRDHFLKVPLAVAGGCRSLEPYGSWEALVRVMGDSRADTIISRRGERWSGEPPRTSDALTGLLAEGFTLGVRAAHRHDRPLAELASRFEHDFAAPVDVHLYCTPANAEGFGWHYDAEDVFVLQTEGSKEWWLRKNTVNPWPLVETLPADMRYEREIMPLMKCRLSAGDWLYIPAGYWHRTQAGERSISLSVGLLSPTGLDVFDFVRKQLVESLLWRCRLPARGAIIESLTADPSTALLEVFGQLGHDLQRILSRPETVRQFLDATAPSRPASDEPVSSPSRLP